MASTPVKQPYQRPEIRRISIVPEEMAAAGCKTLTSMAGPTKAGCAKGSACVNIGS